MKHPILTLLVSLICLSSGAQNFQCLQAGVKHYFTNGNGYLRGIRIDSVGMFADSTIYYPFHTPRGTYTLGSSYSVLDAYVGSWRGKRVVQRADGTYVFDSYWNDSVIIKTQAAVGDTWLFYRDEGSVYYEAKMLSKGEMLVLSVMDSVETIVVNAYNSSGLATSDPVNGFKIILSENYGFLQVFDLYTFPYHKPDSAYRTGLDFYLDESTRNYSSGSSPLPPDTVHSIFKLVDFVNPNDVQMHDWNIGDSVEAYHYFSNGTLSVFFPPTQSCVDYYMETVTGKTALSDNVTYTLEGRPFLHECSDDPSYPLVSEGTFVFYTASYPILSTNAMPEQGSWEDIYYFPVDTSFCRVGPQYVRARSKISVPIEGLPFPVFYKLGLGVVETDVADPNNLVWENDRITYAKLGGVSCGTPVLGVTQPASHVNRIEIYPNPARDELTISATDDISSVEVHNIMGQVMTASSGNGKELHIGVQTLPAGMYYVRVNGDDVRMFIKE